jgi:hypothetical protein
MNHANIEADDVAELQAALAGDPVHDLFIDRDAEVTRKLPVTQERAARPVLPNPFGRKLIDRPRRDSGANELANFFQDSLRQHTGRTHQSQVALALEDDL